jgi:uncharacterized protein YraI
MAVKMKARYWSLAIVLVLINYLIFATLFTRLLETDFSRSQATHTPIPTFTPAPAQPIIIVPTVAPVAPEPSPTATRVLATPESNNDIPAEGDRPQADLSQTANPQLVAPGPVNIRSGPGLNYTVIGTLNPNTAMPIIGRNSDASWWQIEITNGTIGWVSNAVVNATGTLNVPAIEAPPARSLSPAPAQPAASNPPAPTKPKYQYEPTGWWDDGNAGLTRFLGEIKDVNGNPVNSAFIQASCGDYSVISNPSGPVGWGAYSESDTWPPGFYDLTVDTKPVPCLWILTVVDTDDGEHVKAVLSEPIPVEVTLQKSVIIANWQKNW